MRKKIFARIFAAAVVLTIVLAVFSFAPESAMQTLKTTVTPEKTVDGKKDIAGFRTWTKVNAERHLMFHEVAGLCRMATKEDMKMASSVHNNKYIDVYVNSVGKDEMLTKKNPVFPVGTVVVKEKFSERESATPELLTVMIKREKGFNPEVGDWEFMTVNGATTEVTARGELENCQSCHVDYKRTDYITRTYLPSNVWQSLQ